MSAPDRSADLEHIAAALRLAGEVLLRHARDEIPFELKGGHSPVTAADHEVDALLRELLPRPGDGWLSEETADDARRLSCRRVWVVDPLDGTRDYVARRPEYATSIGLVEDGQPVLGGIVNPAAGVTMLGGPGLGVQVLGDPAQPFPAEHHGRLRVLGSRSEWKRGEWSAWLDDERCTLLPVGSVAYKLALVAAGAADATWTLQPKHEWDVAAGAALVLAAGGEIWLPDGAELAFNRPRPLFRSFAGTAPGHGSAVRELLGRRRG